MLAFLLENSTYSFKVSSSMLANKEKAFGDFSLYSCLLEKGPGKLESVHTWTWVVIYNNEFLKTRIFFFAEECGIGICESEKLLIFEVGWPLSSLLTL